MNATKSRLLLYLVLLPGLAIPAAVMLWFPGAYTTAFWLIQSNPLVMLGIAIAGCALFWFHAAAGVPPTLKAAFWVFVAVTAAAAIAYVSMNFNSQAIAEAMVGGGLIVGFVGVAIKDYSARRKGT